MLLFFSGIINKPLPASTLLFFLYGILVWPHLNVKAETVHFSVYCTGNMDETGNCKRDDTGDSIFCVATPGALVACRDKLKKLYECVPFGYMQAGPGQFQFACTSSISKSINSDIFGDSDSQQVYPLPGSPSPTSPPIPPKLNLAPNPFGSNNSSKKYNGNIFQEELNSGSHASSTESQESPF